MARVGPGAHGSSQEHGRCDCCDQTNVPISWVTCDAAKDLNLEPEPDRDPLGDNTLRPRTLKLCSMCAADVPDRNWDSIDDDRIDEADF